LKRLLHASLIACGLIVLLLAILRLPSDSAVASSLKWASANLLLPGTYFGYLAAGSKIDDISFFVADSINFFLYSALIYILLV
jgi:hypothetical protein